VPAINNIGERVMKQNVYFSTFTSGLSSLIEQLLKENLKNIVIIHLFDGGVIYETSSNVAIIKNLKFVNNSFCILHYFKHASQQSVKNVLQEMLAKKISFNKSLLFQGREFKLFFSNENQFISVDKELKNEFAALIRKQYHLSSIPNSSNRPGNEFWILRRSENYCFLMFKISENTEKPLKGELRPELAFIMCYLSQPTAEDRFIDPFAGSGSIPLLRLNTPFKKMSILDKDQSCIELIRKRMSAKKIQKRGDIFIGQQDFLAAPFQENIFNKIVTDPPWGSFTKMDDIDVFYEAMFDKFLYILSTPGIIVLLVERKISPIIERILNKFKNRLTADLKLEILLSGRKATIYKIIKND